MTTLLSTTVSYRVLDLLIDLSKALDEIQRGLAEILATKVPEALPLPPEDSGKRRQFPTDWAKVGGHDFDPRPTDLFKTEEFRKAWKPSGERRACYAAGCYGLRDLGKILKMPLYKVSTTGGDRVWDRMEELKRDPYGELWHDGKSYVKGDGVWNNWFPSHLHPQRFPSPGSPIIAQHRAIIVPLPFGMSAEKFDELFDKEVKKGALNIFVMTQAGRDHCLFLGVDPSVGQRSTRFLAGDQSEISPANEICCFSIFQGADRIIAIAENILLKAVGLKIDEGKTVKD